jgi:general secretion pathway protein J
MTRSNAGFTLVETLVALAVTATLATAGTLLMLQTLQASRAVNTRMDDVRSLEAAFGLMRSDFNEVTRRPSSAPDDLYPPIGFQGLKSDKTGELITFVRAGWKASKIGSERSDLQRVAYVFDKGTLVRKAWLRPDPVSTTPVVERVLMEGIDKLDIRYRRKGAWFDAWPATTNGDYPDLIQFTMTFADQDELTLSYMLGAMS